MSEENDGSVGGNSISLVNLGALSEPAKMLIEKTGAAAWLAYEPIHMVRMAKAEAEAKRIAAFAELDLVSDLEKRAARRVIVEEARNQPNLEAVIVGALKDVNDDARPDKIDDDWMSEFLDNCKRVSDTEMQSLWSRILAGEANSPGTFSKRTLLAIRQLSKKEAESFAALARFTLTPIGPYILDEADPIYVLKGVTFQSLTNLDSIGLVSFKPFAFGRTYSKQVALFSYAGKKVRAELQLKPGGKATLPGGRVLLTGLGSELMKVCDLQPVEGFLDYVLAIWAKHGIVSSSLISDRPL